MKVLPALTAAFLFAASTQTSQAMPCGQYGQLVKNSMNNPAILPMQKQCYVAMAEYMCEECNGNMACMQSRGEIGPEESGRIMQKLTECAELMQLADGFMPKRRLRSDAMPAEVSCDAASLGRMVDAQLPPVTHPAQIIAQGMQKRCFVGIAMDMCEPCDGDTACMQARGQQGGPALMRSTPECAELMQLADGFKPKRRLPASLKEFDELGERVWKSPSRCTNQFCKKDGPNDMACTCLDSDTDASRPRRLKAWLRAIQNKKKCKYRTCRKVGPDGMTCQFRDSIPSTPWHHTHCVQQNEVNCEGTGVCNVVTVQICD